MTDVQNLDLSILIDMDAATRLEKMRGMTPEQLFNKAVEAVLLASNMRSSLVHVVASNHSRLQAGCSACEAAAKLITGAGRSNGEE